MNFKYFKPEAFICLIIALTILFTALSHKLIALLKPFEFASQINEGIHIVSTLSLIIFTFLFLNSIGWKWKIFKWLIDIPNLNGRYRGQLISSYLDENKAPIVKDCAIEIKQTASTIKIFSYSSDSGKNIQTSCSSSDMEDLIKDGDGFFILKYVFSNKADTLQSQLYNKQTQIYNHSGVQEFKYFPDKRILKGEYYNQRQNIGKVEVKFEQDKLLSRLVP